MKGVTDKENSGADQKISIHLQNNFAEKRKLLPPNTQRQKLLNGCFTSWVLEINDVSIFEELLCQFMSLSEKKKENKCKPRFNPLSANPTKWSNTIRRQQLLWGWRLKS